MTFKQSHLSFPISGGVLFFFFAFFLFAPFLFCIPDSEAGLLAQRNDQISQSKCPTASTWVMWVGPELWAAALLNSILLFSMPFYKWRFNQSRPVSQASQASQANIFLLPHQPGWAWGRGNRNAKHLSNVTITTDELGFQEGNNSSMTIFSSKWQIIAVISSND